MRRRVALSSLLLLPLLVSLATAAEPELIPASQGVKDEKQPLVWYDIKLLGVEGRGWNETKSFYDRFPAKAEGVIRQAVWNLSLNSAGMNVRFVTDAPSIQARWKLRSQTLALPHMPATGVSGVDLYARRGSEPWHWVNVGRPTQFPVNQQALVTSIIPGSKEFLLYLPLYNGVEQVEIGLPVDTKLYKAPQWGEQAKPIVFYGTSITHGACASRPGMCYPAIIARRLHRPHLNLGFSGNALMESEIAQLLAELDPCVYVLNSLPNMNATQVRERAEKFVQTLRAARPNTPIVLCEDRTYANAKWVPAQRERNDTSRVELKQAYERLLKAGVKGLYYIDGETQLAADGEDTVDSSHPTDLGFVHMADKFTPVIEKALKP